MKQKSKEFWFIPAKWTYYNIGASIKENNGLADWGMEGLSLKVGDVVFIYITKPYMCIKYKMEVIAQDIQPVDCLQKPEYFPNTEYYQGKKNYFRFKLIEEYPSNKFPLLELRKRGLALPRQIMRIKKDCLRDYLGITE